MIAISTPVLAGLLIMAAEASAPVLASDATGAPAGETTVPAEATPASAEDDPSHASLLPPAETRSRVVTADTRTSRPLVSYPGSGVAVIGVPYLVTYLGIRASMSASTGFTMDMTTGESTRGPGFYTEDEGLLALTLVAAPCLGSLMVGKPGTALAFGGLRALALLVPDRSAGGVALLGLVLAEPIYAFASARSEWRESQVALVPVVVPPGKDGQGTATPGWSGLLASGTF